MAINKTFKDLNEQVELLKSRNIVIHDDNKAKSDLLEINYFNLVNGHDTLLIKQKTPKQYRVNYFGLLLRLHNLDRKLSKEIYNIISIFETKLQSVIAYRLSETFASNPPIIEDNLKYLDINNFSIPTVSSGPAKYVNFFYNSTRDSDRHAFFRKYKINYINFTGFFNGIIFISSDSKCVYDGTFTGSINSQGNNSFKGKLYSSWISTCSATPVTLPLNSIVGNLSELNFSDYQKTQKEYVNEYYNPPLWVTIKSLMFNDLILLLYGIPNNVLNLILDDFKLTIYDKTKFLNALEIIKELRNKCAHHELITRFRTDSKLSIDPNLIRDLNLSPKRATYIIKLLDAIKVLGLFVETHKVIRPIKIFYFANLITGKEWLNQAYRKRIGNF